MNEFKKNSNKQLKKIRMTVQDMRNKFNKVVEILKKSN
jgi:hypothetical protein